MENSSPAAAQSSGGGNWVVQKETDNVRLNKTACPWLLNGQKPNAQYVITAATSVLSIKVKTNLQWILVYRQFVFCFFFSVTLLCIRTIAVASGGHFLMSLIQLAMLLSLKALRRQLSVCCHRSNGSNVRWRIHSCQLSGLPILWFSKQQPEPLKWPIHKLYVNVFIYLADELLHLAGLMLLSFMADADHSVLVRLDLCEPSLLRLVSSPVCSLSVSFSACRSVFVCLALKLQILAAISHLPPAANQPAHLQPIH